MPSRPLFLGIVVSLAGCVPLLPSVTPGFVGTSMRSAGSADLGIQGAGLGVCADACTGLGGGVLRLEPYAGARVSTPLEVAVTTDAKGLWFLPTRFGVRHRFDSGFVIGAGAGPGFTVGSDSFFTSGAIDLEVAGGHEGAKGGWSVAARPGVSLSDSGGDPYWGVNLPVEVAGIAWLGQQIGLGGSAIGGIGYTQDAVFGAFGATVTLVVRLDHREQQPTEPASPP